MTRFPLAAVCTLALACHAARGVQAQAPDATAAASAAEINALRTPRVPAPKPPALTNADEDSSVLEDKLTPQNPELRADLEQRLKALDAAGLSDGDKQKAAAFYQQAIEHFDVAAEQMKAAMAFEARLASLADDVKFEAERLARPLLLYEDVSGQSLVAIEKRAASVEQAVKSNREKLAQMEAEPKLRSQRLAELPKQIDDAKQKLKQITDELSALGGDDSTDLVAAARRAALAQSQFAFDATVKALDREQRLYQQGGDWVKIRRDYYARYVPYKEKRLAQLRQEINRRREADAQQQARLAAEAARAIRPEAVSKLADENKTLAEDRARIAADITIVSKQLSAARTELQTLADQYGRAQEQVELDELSHVSGQLLREQQTKLPNLRALRRSYALREAERSDVLLRIYALNDERSELANIEELADQLAARSGDLSEELRGEIRRLLDAKRDILEPLITDYETYSRNLNELHSAESQLITTTEEYGEFIAERVLWIKSCSVLSRGDLLPAAGALAWSLNLNNWRAAGVAILQAGNRQPLEFTFFALALFALAAVQRPARRRLREHGEEAEKRGCTRLKPTFHALWLTVVLALPWPSLLAFLGWTMDGLDESEFVRSLSVALRFAAVCLLLLELSRHLCRRGGLADAHFDWPQAAVSYSRRRLRWLAIVGLPLVIWLTGLEVQRENPLSSSSMWSPSLGRVSFIAVMLHLAVTFQRMLLARKSPFRQLMLVTGGGWLKPIELVWRPAVVLLPLSLAVLAAVGYYFTAQQAAVRILQTVGMLLAVLALGGVTRRWLLVSRRKIAREQARQRRLQMAAVAEADPAEPLLLEPAEDTIDLAAISDQTQKLVRTFLAITTTVGLVLIWGEILPALAYPAGHTLPGAKELTWGNLFAFFLILAVTWVCVRDVPALLELAILQHLPLDSGSRYAFTSVSRYVLSAVGLVAAFNSIGGNWDKVQWLVAAMSVGLGFGLQEIFANFVSGIILLFERPIRVGDVVTLGDKTGVVNRIRMRATTIIDPDRKEYIVPNKDLVTGRLLNWTLTDFTNRIEIVVNVASGTDTDSACALMLEAAREQPHVLADPSPSAAFEGFAENGLKLVLRCFLPNLDSRSSTIHALYTTVDRKFRAAGVEGPHGDMRIRVARTSPAGALRSLSATSEDSAQVLAAKSNAA